MKLKVLIVFLLIGLSSFNPANSLYKGLVCHYRFQEGSGLIIDDVHRKVKLPNKANGIVWKQTERGQLPYFDKATTTHIPLVKTSAFDFQSKPMTISCWARMGNVINTYHYFVSDYANATDNSQFSLGYTNTNVFRMFWLNNGSAAILTGVGSPVVDTWYHVVGVRSGNTGSWTLTLYVNGLQQSTSSTAINPPSQANAGTFTIGRPGSLLAAGTPLLGYVDEVMIWDRAISHSEVRQLFTDQKDKFKK